MTFALFSDLDGTHTPTDGSFPVSAIHPGTTVITFTASGSVTITAIAAIRGQDSPRFSLIWQGSIPVTLTNGQTFKIAVTYTPSGSGVPEYVHFCLDTNLGLMDVRIQGLPT
jgi:hypothetical protein